MVFNIQHKGLRFTYLQPDRSVFWRMIGRPYDKGWKLKHHSELGPNHNLESKVMDSVANPGLVMQEVLKLYDAVEAQYAK